MSVAARKWVAENYEDRRVLGMAVDFYLNLLSPSGPADAGMEEKRISAVTGLPASL
jgi:hypothetical protein